ncbi:hypothetical protein EON65_17475 [archaeon]|nr:MAG: hypothetical protein EON65_17475 [archaeon]
MARDSRLSGQQPLRESASHGSWFFSTKPTTISRMSHDKGVIRLTYSLSSLLWHDFKSMVEKLL